MTSPFHSQQTTSDGIHIPYAFEYSDATARISATGLTTSDIGKFARQIDNNTIWILTNNSPVTWGKTISIVTQTEAGLMSATDKINIDSFGSGNVLFTVKNETGATLEKGMLVAASGFNVGEDTTTVFLADKDDPDRRPALGFVVADILNDTTGQVMISGILHDVNTSTYSITDQLVLGNDGYVSRPPADVGSSFTGEIQNVGSVVKVDTLGDIIVSMDGMESISATESFALAGTDGAPSDTNKYVTDSDPRNTNSRIPTLHATTHQDGGSDEIATSTATANAIPKALSTGLLDPNWTAKGRTIIVAKSGGDYTSVKSAVDSILDASVIKPYTVQVYPGVYVEAPFSLQPYIAIAGVGGPSSVILAPSNNSSDFITGASNSSLYQMLIRGPTGSGNAAIRYVDESAGQFAILNVVIQGGDYGIAIDSVTTTNNFIFSRCFWSDPGYSVTNIMRVTGKSKVIGNGFLITGSSTIDAAFYLVGSSPSCDISSIDITHTNVNDAVFVDGYGDFQFTNSIFSNCVNAFHVGPSIGPASLVATSMQVNNAIKDLFVEAEDSIVEFGGAAEKEKFDVNPLSNFSASFTDNTPDVEGLVVFGELWLGTLEKSIPLRSYAVATFSTGWVSGGAVTRATGLDVDVTDGYSFINDGTGVFKVDWIASTITLTADATQYIYVNSSGTITNSTFFPDTKTNIVLASARTDSSSVILLSKFFVSINQFIPRHNAYVQDVIGPVHVVGLATTISSPPSLQLAVDSGSFYIADDLKQTSPSDPITFTYWYRDNPDGEIFVTGLNNVDPDSYDDGSGTLAPIDTGKWKKDLLFVAQSDDGTEYHIVYGQEVFEDQGGAEAGPIPTASDILLSNSLRLAGIVSQQGSGMITSITDERPKVGQLSTGSTTVTDHGLLTGLFHDDHPQYQLRTEKGAIGGYASLDAGALVPADQLNLAISFPVNVTKATAVVGVSSEISRSDHKHDVSTATASSLDATSTNAEGSSSSLSRADHIHTIDVTNGSVSTILAGAVNSAGIATGLSRKDHIHDVTTATAGTIAIGDAAAEGSATSFSRSDHRHSLPSPAAPINVTKATADAGVATTVARSDHKHDVTTATAGTILIGDAAAEGSATSLARSDHKHALTAPSAPADVTKATANAGVATTVARSDHKHDVTTATAGTIAIGDTAAEGTATSLARSDHRHALPSPAAPANVTKSTALAGVATTVARADHKHDVTTATAGTISVGDAAAEGSATSLSRSDHIHALTAPAAPANVTKTAADAGAATTVARSDHKHDVTTAAPTTTLTPATSNAEGSATSLARSDHTHTVNLVSTSATATGTITTTSLTDVLMTTMTITPDAGTYLAIFSCSASNSNAGKSVFASFYVNGVQVSATERQVSGSANNFANLATNAIITPAGGQAVEVRWRVDANTGTTSNRILNLIRIA
jgi:hypothetical protein